MTKILVECPQQIASVRVGVLEPLKPLEEAELCQVHYRDTKDITKGDIAWCDVLVCVRGCEYPTLDVVRAAKAAGKFLVYFLDDDLLHVPDGNESSNYYRDNTIKVNLVRIMKLCDVLWAVNRQILNQYGKYVPRSVLLRVPAKLLRHPPVSTGPIRILYAGSTDHSKLARELLAPAAQRILKEYLGKVVFTFIGADPGLRHTVGVVYHPYFESYDEYQKTILSSEFSIGLAPVYDTPFHACKYYNKFIEYSRFGIAGIYSDCEPYRQIVAPGENGVLCENTAEGWYQAIKSLLEDPEAVRRMALRAGELLEDQFNYQAVAEALKKQLPEVVSFRASPISEANIRLSSSLKALFYQERLRLLFRTYGILAVFVIFLKAVKKTLKYIKKKWERR